MTYIEIATPFLGVTTDDLEVPPDLFINRLHDLWTGDAVPLSGVVYWYATGGALLEPDDEAVERAAELVVAALKTRAIVAEGVFRGEDFAREIPSSYFRYVSKFPPDGDDLLKTTGGKPRLFWNVALDEDRADCFIKNVDTVLIDIVTIDRDAMMRLWPIDKTPFTATAATAGRGRKPAYDWGAAKDFVFDLLNERGDYDGSAALNDTEWTQAMAEKALAAFMARHGAEPAESTIRLHLTNFRRNWLTQGR